MLNMLDGCAEQGRHNQNHAVERVMWFLEKLWRRRMNKKVIPKRLWYFGLVHGAELLYRISVSKYKRNGYEKVTGKTSEISEYLNFDFYNLVWWWS